MNTVDDNVAVHTSKCNGPQINPGLPTGYLTSLKSAGRKLAEFFSLAVTFPLTFYRTIRSRPGIFHRTSYAPSIDGYAKDGFKMNIFTG